MEEQKIKEIIEEMPQYKVNKIANEIAIRIINVFGNLKEEYSELLKRLEQCKTAREDRQSDHFNWCDQNRIYFHGESEKLL